MRSILFAAALVCATPAFAQSDVPTTPAGKDALDILTKAIAFRTVIGSPDQFAAYADYLKGRLVAAGLAEADVAYTPLAKSGYFTARFPGRDAAAKPIVLIGHMDVVEAKREDWERDPFVPVVENGYVYGRGSLDNKGDVSMLVAALVKLKQSGWRPSRDIVLALSGDEETDMATTQALAERFRNAEYVLNADSGGGLLGEDGKPIIYGLQAGEKSYGDYVLTVTDPGGHSSRPGPNNAIYKLAAALRKLEAYKFPAELSPLTKAFWEASAPRTPGALGQAMKAFAANPRDEAAIDALSANQEYVGTVRTTCVATMLEGGHAPNALPQKAAATVNCRIFPGHSFEEIGQQLNNIVADPAVKVSFSPSGTLPAPESPLRPDVVKAVTDAVRARAPGLPIVPQMSSGATDSMHFRAVGVPAYGVGTVFIRAEDDFAHGLNERLPVATLDPGVKQWEAVLKAVGR